VKIVLEWVGPELVKNLFSHSHSKGVYLWGFTIDQKFIPYYLGIAEDINFRLLEHIKSIISGNYRIFHKDSLADFVKYKMVDVHPDKSKGVLYIPNWPDGYQTFLQERHQLQPHIDYMIDTFTFFYASINDPDINKYDLQEIEKICINHIGKESLLNMRGGHSERFQIEHKGNKTLLQQIYKNNTL
jgi:hypothetical protein